MGVPFYAPTFSSLTDMDAFIHQHPDVLEPQVTVLGLHVRDVFTMAKVLSEKRESGWNIQNLDLLLDDGRKFALYIEEYDFTVGEALRSINDDGIITAGLAENLRQDAVKFLNLVSGHASYDLFRGFAQYSVRVGDEAIQAVAAPDGEENAGADGESDGADGDEDAASDGERDGVDSDEDAGAEGEEDAGVADDNEEVADGEEAVQVPVQAPNLVQLRGKLVQIKGALERLPALRIIILEPEENPVTYADFADLADSYPLDPVPEPAHPPALPAGQQAPQE